MALNFRYTFASRAVCIDDSSWCPCTREDATVGMGQDEGLVEALYRSPNGYEWIPIPTDRMKRGRISCSY